MPLLSRWCVRCALAYLIIGMGIGSWMLIQQSRGHPAGAPWPALHAHLLLVGFFLLLVMGVAHWMFPRVSGTRPGRTGGWIAFWLVNAGLLLRVLAEPMVDHGHGTPWTWVLEAAAVLPTIGIAAFSITILPRVRAAIDPETARALRARVKD
jgi:hypothetical protein